MRLALCILLTGCSAGPEYRMNDLVIPPPYVATQDRRFTVPQTDETASQEFLEQEIVRNARPPEPPLLPPAVDRMYYPNRYIPQETSEDPTAAFPWATLYGASIGALIGSTSHDAGEGAAIGAGIGFLLDLGRWNR